MNFVETLKHLALNKDSKARHPRLRIGEYITFIGNTFSIYRLTVGIVPLTREVIDNLTKLTPEWEIINEQTIALARDWISDVLDSAPNENKPGTVEEWAESLFHSRGDNVV